MEKEIEIESEGEEQSQTRGYVIAGSRVMRVFCTCTGRISFCLHGYVNLFCSRRVNKTKKKKKRRGEKKRWMREGYKYLFSARAI